ncbi:MAG: PilZ domain-containing protein [Anaerolineales bacterium]|nr:PilZ domain-containing protein [Anaerolineales bacterium]
MEKRKLDRRAFSYYMRVLDAHTGKLVGHLVDISADGFKVDSQSGISLNVDFLLRMDIPAEISNTKLITFSACPKWCKPDRFDPTAYNIGFQITAIDSVAHDIFARMFEKYGTQTNSNNRLDNDYFWR